MSNAEQLGNSLAIENGETLIVNENTIAPSGEAAITIPGSNAQLTVDSVNNYTVNNSGSIDAGEGNNGPGVSVSLGDEPVNAAINNSGTIQGRTTAGEPLAPTSPQAGDGIRLEGVRSVNAEGNVAFAPATFIGEVTNSGLITSGDNVSGSTAGFHAVNGVSFQGRLNNTGTISGTQNGVYFGNEVPGGGADHTGGVFSNEGLVSSDSRAVNLDGNGLTFNNSGSALGTGDQRGGAVFLDGTSDDITINNSGLIDAGEGNNGSGVAVQVGTANASGGNVDDTEVSATINNDGLIQGRGTTEDPNGIRLFVGDDLEEATFTGEINNNGTVASETEAGISIEEGVIFDGQIVNNGTVSGGNGLAIDATGAGGQVNVENNATLDGGVILGDGDDIFVQNSSEGVEVTGGLGDDSITGGADSDTVRFDDIDVGVNVDLAAGNAQRETGFEVAIDNFNLANPNDGIDSASIISEGIDGNLYFNFHTTDFPGGELRGQLELFADNRDVNGVGTVVFSSSLSGDQEVQDEPVVTDAFGSATVTFTVAEDGSIAYSTTAFINGLSQADLLPVDIGNGTLSPIHLHNAAAGANGPVVVDVFTDAGSSGLVAVEETDSLVDIENVVGSNDADLIIGDAGDNVLEGLDGNDTLIGGEGIDSLNGGEGNDAVDFSDASEGVIIDLDVNSAGSTGTPSQDGAILDAPPAAGGQVLEEVDDVENVVGSGFDDALFGNNEVNVLQGGLGDDTIHSFGGADVLDGGEGTDLALFTAGGAVEVDLDENGDAVSSLGDTLSSFENINGSNAGDDVISGNNLSNVLNGQDGNDLLNGEGGDDTLIGGAGVDSLDGGEGIDTVDFSGSSEGVIIDLDVNSAGSTGTPSQDGAILDAPPAAGGQVLEEVDDVENVVGSGFDDALFGNNEVNVLQGGLGDDTIHSFGGADVLDGGEGTDLALFTAGGAVEVDLDENGDAVSSLGDTLSSFENINGSNAGDDVISGNNLSNVLNGQDGNDLLNGEGGDDNLVGGAGNDTLVGGAGVDSLDGGEGIDTVDFSGSSEGVIIDLDVNSAGSTGTPSQDGAILDAPPAAGGQVLEEVDDVENVVGSGFDDALFGNNEVNVLQGGLGDDTIHCWWLRRRHDSLRWSRCSRWRRRH